MASSTRTRKKKNSGQGQATTQQASGYTAFQWLLAWGVLLAILAILNRTRIGHLVIYYALLLSVLFLLVTQYAWIHAALAPIQTLSNDNADNEEQGAPRSDATS